jgi:hypothetical protein
VIGFLRRDGLGNPTQEAQQAAAQIQALIAPIAPEIKVLAVVAFLDPLVRVEVQDSTVPVVYANPQDKAQEYDSLFAHIMRTGEALKSANKDHLIGNARLVEIIGQFEANLPQLKTGWGLQRAR